MRVLILGVGLALIFSLSAHASGPAVHIAVGDLIGEWAARHIENPTLARTIAVLGGFLSHIVLDELEAEYVPDWTSWLNNRKRLEKDLPYVLSQAALTWLVVQNIGEEPDDYVRQLRELGAIAGVIPDLIEVPHSLINPESWKKGDHIFPWHRARTYRTPEPAHLSITISATAVSVRLSIQF